uniref:Uncharacterized protein n=1 Tax=viral metagenome TaxID=1070528 RepID=A0A6C0BGW2_9ZZZZ
MTDNNHTYDVFLNILYRIFSNTSDNLHYNDMICEFDVLNKHLDDRYINLINEVISKNNGFLKNSYSDLLTVYEMYQLYMGAEKGMKRKIIETF